MGSNPTVSALWAVRHIPKSVSHQTEICSIRAFPALSGVFVVSVGRSGPSKSRCCGLGLLLGCVEADGSLGDASGDLAGLFVPHYMYVELVCLFTKSELKGAQAMTGVTFSLISAEEQWEIFDDAARRLLDIDGAEFARRWDCGEYLGKDEPGVMQVAILRPSGWPHAC